MADQFGNTVDREVWVPAPGQNAQQNASPLMRPWFGAVVSARLGFRVGIFATSAEKAREILGEVEAHMDEDDAPLTVRRVNGDQRIDFPDGAWIRFLSIRGVRGSIFDRLYIPAGSSEDVLLEVTPALSTSSNAAIIGYF